MGLFDFLKPKKEASFADKPAVRNAMAFMELETIQKRVANMCAVGRDEDAKKLIGDFVARYGRESVGQVCTPLELTKLSYTATYMYLPELVFNQWSEFKQLWSSKLPFSVHLALTVATRTQKRLSADQVNQFKSMQGSIGEDTDCYMIEFPLPPEPEGELDLEALKAALGGGGAGLSLPFYGPFYAVVSHRPATDQRWIHVLGQAANNGTDIRTISATASWYSGIGPDPALPKDFLRAILPLLK